MCTIIDSSGRDCVLIMALSLAFLNVIILEGKLLEYLYNLYNS